MTAIIGIGTMILVGIAAYIAIDWMLAIWERLRDE